MRLRLVILGAIGLALLIVLKSSRYAPEGQLQWPWLYGRSAESLLSLLENESSAALPRSIVKTTPLAARRSEAAAEAATPSEAPASTAEAPAGTASPANSSEASVASPNAAEAPAEQSPYRSPAAAKASLSKAPSTAKAQSRCNVYSGKWVWDENYTTFQPFLCPFVDEAFRCQENGRPDNDYLKWRWKPLHCDLPRFNATLMLEKLRNKKLVFIGDSLGRNQWESLVCMLYQGIQDRSKVKMSKQTRVSKNTESYSIYFTDHGTEIGFLRSNFLVVDKTPGPNLDPDALLLDKADHSKGSWNGDILVFNSGHWWNHAKIVEGKCSLVTKSGEENIDVVAAFEKAMKTWSRWVDSHFNSNSSARVLFRLFSPNHFSGGAWNTGGSCINFTRPVEDSTGVAAEESERQKVSIVERVVRGMKTRVTLLNSTGMSVLRRDAHVSSWGGDSAKQDCSHWCLPGLPDVWNELLYYEILSP